MTVLDMVLLNGVCCLQQRGWAYVYQTCPNLMSLFALFACPPFSATLGVMLLTMPSTLLLVVLSPALPPLLSLLHALPFLSFLLLFSRHLPFINAPCFYNYPLPHSPLPSLLIHLATCVLHDTAPRQC